MKNLLPEIQEYVESLDFSKISTERKKLLRNLSDYISKKLSTGEDVILNFICTHNSRRSQLCQVWAQTAAFSYGIDVRTISGGTEATAFHPNAVGALKNIGFQILNNKVEKNPAYFVHYSKLAEPMICFSKLYNDPGNGTAPYIAIMTCSDAEANCPYIPEAEARFAIKYEDPKSADGTSQEAQAYADTSKLIATELFYLFSAITR